VGQPPLFCLKKEQNMDTLKQRIEPMITALGYYLYDVEKTVEQGETILRVMIDNDTTITVDDCVAVSNVLNEAFDLDDPIQEPYNLEVTSAGAEHELRNSEEINRAMGKDVFVQTFEQTISGQLVSYKDGELTIQVTHKKTTKVHEMDISLIRLAIIL
jgi:ribosome maturation factor RimP